MRESYLLISDIHDNNESISLLYKKLRNKNFEAIIFCGDAVAPFTINNLIEKFKEKTRKFILVLGNNEGEIFKIVSDYLKRQTDFDIVLSKDFILTKIENEKVLITHGWGDIALTKAIIKSLGKSGDYKYIFYGHTHQSELLLIKKNNEILELEPKGEREQYEIDLNEMKSIIINPGELGGWLTGVKRFAILELEEKVRISFETI